MSSFIVSGGALLEIGCPSTLSRSTEQQVSFTPIIGGKRKAFVRKGGRRSWSIDTSVARPSEVSTIETVARFMGPVGWYGPEAAIGNLLSPQASGFDTVPTTGTDAGLVQLPDAGVARAVAHAGVMSVGVSDGGYEAVPVRTGLPVTFSAWGFGGVRFTGTWRDASRAQIGTFAQAAHTFTGWGWRSFTVTPPVGVAFAQMVLSTGSIYARPSVSWGVTGRDELGTGCPKAVIHSPSHSPVALWGGANYTDSGFRVTEVG